nr:LacI family DNA-binding transcriptional regulator [Halomonas socia]
MYTYTQKRLLLLTMDIKRKRNKKRLNSMDIATLAGVSQATVSRVLQNSDKVHPDTRQRVLDILKQTDYAPNIWAQAMKNNRSDSIGIVVSRITNPLYPEILDIVSELLTSRGKRMIVWNGEGSGEEAALSGIEQSLVDGVLFTTATDNSIALHRALALDAPAVMINRTVDLPGCVSVTSDNYSGGVQVAEYFVKHGRHRIGLLPGSRAASTLRGREDGFRNVLERLGIDIFVPNIPVQEISHGYGRDAMAALLHTCGEIDAVFCINDLVALGAMDALLKVGLRVPEDVWVVGFDDISMASWETNSLSTVRQPIETMVREGVDLLLKRIDRIDEESRVLPVEFIPRRSTAYS